MNLPSSRSPVARVGFFLLAALVAVGSALALLSRPGRGSPPTLHAQAFKLAERERDFQRVTVARPLLLPYIFGDCDVLATVMVPAGGELDLVFRRHDLAEGHGRFAVLRLSGVKEASPWRTREGALFAVGESGDGGVMVTPGLPASIRLELRGRRARANVAGRWLPEFCTTDDRGSLAFVVRRGEAEIPHLHVQPLPAPEAWRWRLGLVALLGVLLVALLPHGLGARPGRIQGWLALGLLPLSAWGVHAWLARQAVVGASFSEAGLGCVLGALVLALIAVARSGSPGRTLGRAVVALACLAVGLEAFCRAEAPRLLAFEDPRLDLYFGVDSRTAPFDALAKQLQGKNEVHLAEPDLSRVVFLGGAPLFEANLDRTQHLAIQACVRASFELHRKLLPAVFPTLYPHTLQQTALFERFYADDYPAVAVVLGVDRWEAQSEGAASARTRLQNAQSDAGPPTIFAAVVLRGLWQASAVIAPPAELAITLNGFADYCAARKLPLVLATHALLPAPHLAVVESLARARGLALVRDAMTSDDRADIEALSRALVETLR